MALRSCFPSVRKGLVGLIASLLVCAGMLEAKQDAGYSNKILLIRGLDHEVAIAKVPLPWGKHGVRVNRDGKFDQAEALKELHARGESVKPGIPVEITDMKFGPGRITFSIN